MTCGLLTNPKGKLIVTGAATKDAAKADAVLSLGDAITAYKAYVTAETAQLVSGNQSLYRRGESRRYRKSESAVRPDASALRAHRSPLPSCSLTLTAASTPAKTTSRKKRKIRNFTGFHRLGKSAVWR